MKKNSWQKKNLENFLWNTAEKKLVAWFDWIMIKQKQKVSLKERNKKVMSCNWDIYNSTINLCRIFWYHSNDRFFEDLKNGHRFFVVLPPTNKPSLSKHSAVFVLVKSVTSDAGSQIHILVINGQFAKPYIASMFTIIIFICLSLSFEPLLLEKPRPLLVEQIQPWTVRSSFGLNRQTNHPWMPTWVA